MAENIQPARRGRLTAYALLAIAVVAGGVVGITQLASHGETTVSSPDGTTTPTDPASPQEDDVNGLTSDFSPLLPEAANGQDAIDSLGDSITVAAKRNNMTVDELTELLLRDQSVHISANGYILYIDTIQKRD